MKRFLILLLVLTVTASLFAAGGGGQAQPQGATERVVTHVTPRPLTVGSQLPPEFRFYDPIWHPQPATYYATSPRYPQQPPISNPNGFPITQQPTVMSVGHDLHFSVLDIETNAVVRFMEELTNIRIDWHTYPTEAVQERVNIMFASGENLPDIFWGVSFSMAMLNNLGPAGLIVPLEDLMWEHMPNFTRRLEQNPIHLASMRSFDGNIYTLAGGGGTNLANMLSMRMWINHRFMETLGMTMPQTTEDWYRYLVAVRDRDPNGNGLRDEIPMIGGGRDSWHSHIDGFLMNSFIINETSDSRDPLQRRRVFLTESGQVDVAYNKPEWRQGLAYLHRLYSEELIAAESFTINRAGVLALVEFPDFPLVGATPNGGPHEFANTGGDRRTHFTIVPPLIGPNGVRQAHYDQFLGTAGGGGSFVITRDCLIPEIAIKWVDYMSTPDFSMRNRYGILGQDWFIPPPGTIAVDGTQAIFEEVLVIGSPQNSMLLRGGGGWGAGVQSYNRTLTPDPYELEAVLWNARQVYYPYRFQRSVPRNISFTVEEARQFNELNANLVLHAEQFMTQVITGRTVLNDANWNAYVQEIDRMGLAQMLRIIQGGFDRQWAEPLGYR